MQKQRVRMIPVVRLAVIILASAWGLTLSGDTRGPKPLVLPPSPEPFTTIYENYEAAWSKWWLEYPLAGHPSTEDSLFDVSARQSGPVWFLAAPFDTITRDVIIPRDKALFFGTLTVECSSIEPPESGFHGDTEEEQRACAAYWADHIVDVFCTIDGLAINMEDFRFSSPQYTFTAPDPWIGGTVGAGETGTSVADGYYVMLAPLRAGNHTLRYGGSFHFSVAEGDPFDGDFGLDMTYNITVK